MRHLRKHNAHHLLPRRLLLGLRHVDRPRAKADGEQPPGPDGVGRLLEHGPFHPEEVTPSLKGAKRDAVAQPQDRLPVLLRSELDGRSHLGAPRAQAGRQRLLAPERDRARHDRLAVVELAEDEVMPRDDVLPQSVQPQKLKLLGAHLLRQLLGAQLPPRQLDPWEEAHRHLPVEHPPHRLLQLR